MGILIGRYFIPPATRHKIVSERWLRAHKITPDERNFLITDGKEVLTHYAPEYNEEGELMFCLMEDKKATHWMPYPQPPEMWKDDSYE